MNKFLALVLIGLLFSCTEESESIENTFKSEVTQVETLFDKAEFDNPEYEGLLAELHMCNSEMQDSMVNGRVPCTPQFFEFYAYTEKTTIENAFALQVRSGVNNFGRRRLLLFMREKGELVLMNGIVGYLQEKRTTESGFDDLVVGIMYDNMGSFYRFDVLLSYKDGKYHFVEALGDVQGEFTDSIMKKNATEEIGEIIKREKLLF